MMNPMLHISLVLMGFMGLHLPRAFTAFYVLILLMAWCSRNSSSLDPGLRRSCLLLLLFGLSYDALSIHYGLWRLTGRDLLDVVAMLFLPALGVWVGARAAGRLSRTQMGWLWLVYGLGALAYAGFVLLHGRVLEPGAQWLDLVLQRRESTIDVPWGTSPQMNVRSIEQNATFALSWLLPGLVLLRRPSDRVVGSALLAVAIAGLIVVLAFSGRLGFLALIASAVPSVWVLCRGRLAWARVSRWLPWITVSLAMLLMLSLLIGRGPILPRLLSRLYDERFDRFVGLLSHLGSTLMGGQSLQFQYFDQQRQLDVTFDAATGDLLHNVPFDVVIRVGLFPALFLLLATLPLLARALQQLKGALLDPDTTASALISSGFLATLVIQWLFQPLIYGDGLLFFLGFLFLGSWSVPPSDQALGSCEVYAQANKDGQA